jgi:membrane-bound lytic murein transglycosylase MltF
MTKTPENAGGRGRASGEDPSALHTQVDEMIQKLLETAQKYAYAVEGCYDQIRATRYKDPDTLHRELDILLAKLIRLFEKHGYDVDFGALQDVYGELREEEEYE